MTLSISSGLSSVQVLLGRRYRDFFVRIRLDSTVSSGLESSVAAYALEADTVVLSRFGVSNFWEL